jgi:hypothetical protein
VAILKLLRFNDAIYLFKNYFSRHFQFFSINFEHLHLPHTEISSSSARSGLDAKSLGIAPLQQWTVNKIFASVRACPKFQIRREQIFC